MIAARLLAVCSLLVVSVTAHAAALTRAEKATIRKGIRADAKTSGVYPAGQRPSLVVKFKDNGNGTHTASADTRTLQPAWPSFNLVRRTLATATFRVTESLATVTPPPAPTVAKTNDWAVRMYALSGGN